MSKVWGSMPSAFKKGNRAVTKVPSQQSEFQRASAPTRQWCSVWRGAVSPGSTGDWKTQLQWGRQCRGGPTEGPHLGSPLHTQLKCTWIWGRWWQTPTSDSAAQRQGNVRAAAPHCDKASAMSQNRHARLQESRVHSPFPAFGREQVSFLKGLQSSRRRHRPRQSTTGLPAATQDSNRAAMATPSDCPCSSLDRSCKRVTASMIGEW